MTNRPTNKRRGRERVGVGVGVRELEEGGIVRESESGRRGELPEMTSIYSNTFH